MKQVRIVTSSEGKKNDCIKRCPYLKRLQQSDWFEKQNTQRYSLSFQDQTWKEHYKTFA